MAGECAKHGDMMRIIGEQVEQNRQQSENIDKIFDLLGGIKTAVDQNSVRAEVRDQKLCEIDRKIENGLRAAVVDCAKKIDQLFTCMDRRKRGREEGIEGFFVKGFRKIHDNGGMITILAIGYMLLWMLARTKIFGDTPDGLLKILGLG